MVIVFCRVSRTLTSAWTAAQEEVLSHLERFLFSMTCVPAALRATVISAHQSKRVEITGHDVCIGQLCMLMKPYRKVCLFSLYSLLMPSNLTSAGRPIQGMKQNDWTGPKKRKGEPGRNNGHCHSLFSFTSIDIAYFFSRCLPRRIDDSSASTAMMSSGQQWCQSINSHPAFSASAAKHDALSPVETGTQPRARSL